MKKFVILTDSTSDISQEIRDRFGVVDYVPGHVHFSDGRDLVSTLDWSKISREEFYGALSNKRLKVSTAPSSPEEYYEIFLKYAKEGYDILSISISTQISITRQNAQKAADRVMEEVKGCDIVCIDSLRMSGSLGLLTVYAHEMQKAGKSMREIANWLEETKHKVHQMGPIDDLIFVARRGRLSMGKAIMGSFAGVKPMGDSNKDGYVTVLTKVKGMKKALAVTVAYIKEVAVDIENQYVYITHSNREAYAYTLKEMVEKELHPKEVLVSDVFPASGTNIGPGMVCAYAIGNPISDDCAVERELMKKAVENCK